MIDNDIFEFLYNNILHIKKSYLLKHNGISVGFVYDIGLKKVN